MRYWIWLTQIKGIGPVTAHKLLDHFHTPENIYLADEKELRKIKGIQSSQVKNILCDRNLDYAESVWEHCTQHQISIITLNDGIYPEGAKQLPDSPILLYQKGSLDLSKLGKTVGIVGARRCTQDDKKVTAEITEKYADDGYCIISGMAKGVDSYAHTACINYGGKTLAFLANGLDICYPKEHLKLMEMIAEQGMLLSEYAPGTPPERYAFPRRNRLIGAWSDELVVIAAGRNSGANITADYARLYGKEVKICHNPSVYSYPADF